jgi:hypothetical protein
VRDSIPIRVLRFTAVTVETTREWKEIVEGKKRAKDMIIVLPEMKNKVR